MNQGGRDLETIWEDTEDEVDLLHVDPANLDRPSNPIAAGSSSPPLPPPSHIQHPNLPSYEDEHSNQLALPAQTDHTDQILDDNASVGDSDGLGLDSTPETEGDLLLDWIRNHAEARDADRNHDNNEADITSELEGPDTDSDASYATSTSSWELDSRTSSQIVSLPDITEVLEVKNLEVEATETSRAIARLWIGHASMVFTPPPPTFPFYYSS